MGLEYYIDLRYWIGNSATTSRNGSINSFTDLKLYHLDTFCNHGITGDIEIAHKSCGKGFYKVRYHYASGGYTVYNQIYGSISVWSDCYDLEYIAVVVYAVSGTWSMLNKLQKLRECYNLTGCSGSKNDLYNGGKNIVNNYVW